MNASIAKKMGLLDTGSNGTGNYSSLTQLRDDFAQRRQAIEDDWTLPDRAKNLKLAQLKNEMRDAWHKTKQDLEQKRFDELGAAWKKANPTPSVGDMTPGQIQARQEILEDVLAIVNSIESDDPYAARNARGEAIMELYGRYLAQGYELGLDTIADRATKYLNADQQQELQQIEEQRKPSLAEARQNLQQLRHTQSKEGTAQAMMESTFMQATQLTSEENQALAQEPKAPPADAVAAWQQANQQQDGTE